jgi:hypothetical protein
VDGIDAIAVAIVHTLPAIPPRIRLHAVAIAHACRRPTNGASHAVAIIVAVAARLAATVVAGARVAVLLGSSAVVAAPPTVVSTHDICLVGAHGLRSTSVFAINGCFERLDGVERTLPSGTCGVGKVWIGCGKLDFVALSTQHKQPRTNWIAVGIVVLERPERLQGRFLERSSDYDM